MSIVAYGPYNFSISAKKQRYVVNEGRAQVFCAASFLSHYGDRIDVLRDVGPRKTFLIRISAASTVCRRNIPRIWRTPRCSSSKNNRLSTAEPVGPRGVLLFHFSKESSLAVHRWISGIDATLPVVSCSCPITSDLRLSDALKQLENAKSSSEYNGGGKLDDRPIAIFSGLNGEEVEGLVEFWREFTGLDDVSFGIVTEAILNKPVDTVLHSISRKSSRSLGDIAQNQEKFSVMTEDGKSKEMNKEELRHRLNQMMQQNHRRSSPRSEENRDNFKLRKARENRNDPGRGFGTPSSPKQ